MPLAARKPVGTDGWRSFGTECVSFQDLAAELTRVTITEQAELLKLSHAYSAANPAGAFPYSPSKEIPNKMENVKASPELSFLSLSRVELSAGTDHREGGHTLKTPSRTEGRREPGGGDMSS